MTHGITPNFVLLVFAFVFFVIAAVPYPFGAPPGQAWPYRMNLVAAGLACWVGSLLF
jgi:hypothetical protein